MEWLNLFHFHPQFFMENAKGTTNFIIKVLYNNIRYIYIYIYIYYKNETSIYHITVFGLKQFCFPRYIFDVYVVNFALNIKSLILYCVWAKQYILNN